MLNQLSLQTKLILAIIFLLLLFGLTYLFGPMIVIATLYMKKEHLLTAPIAENYHYLILAFVCLIVALSVLAYKKTIATIVSTFASVLLFGYFMYLSAQGHLVLHEQYILVKKAKEEQQIYWEDLTKIEYADDLYGIPKQLYFYSEDEKISIETTGQFTYGIIATIRDIAQRQDVPYEDVSKN